MTEDIWEDLLSICDDASLNAWATHTYWGDVRPKLKEGLEKLKAHYEPIEKQAETLRFLFGDEGIKTINLEKIQIWREKADLWDQYAIYDNDKKEEILVKDLITAYEKIGVVKTYITKLRDQAEKTNDIFERGFCTGIADGLDKILEAEGK